MTIFQQGSLAKHYLAADSPFDGGPGDPVLLAEEGRVLGVCGEAEIIGALAARS